VTSGEGVTIRFVRLRPNARQPQRATPGATGYDLHACLEEPGCLDVGSVPVRVPTGVVIEAPPGCDVQIRPRSGLSLRGVMCVFGTLDPDYRGELFVTLYTTGTTETHRVLDGERIAQLVVARALEVTWEEAQTLSDTARGDGGHGSTGR
jgi:dUTP pyrophosphatase